MRPLISELYSSSKDNYQLNLIAGSDGLINTVNWVYLTEDIQNINFLRGNELVITTGLPTVTDKEWIYHLIIELISKQCSGLIINTGNYVDVKNISSSVIELCNQKCFPLFAMPWHIHISDIMQDYCNQIFINTYQENTLLKLLQSIIFNPETTKALLPQLNNNGFETVSPYTVLLIHGLNSPLHLQRQLNSLSIRHYICLKDNIHILILPDCKLDILDKFLDSYYQTIYALLATDKKYTIPLIGISDTVSSLEKLHFAYSNAKYALKATNHLKKSYVYFHELGIYRILLSVSNKGLLEHIYYETLNPLLKYDEENNGNLVQTLQMYLDFDGSIQETADILYTHRNTVNYRIKKIRSLLPYNLSSMEDKFTLKMAFYIKDVLEMLE